jgi:hypothetical protein
MPRFTSTSTHAQILTHARASSIYTLRLFPSLFVKTAHFHAGTKPKDCQRRSEVKKKEGGGARPLYMCPRTAVYMCPRTAVYMCPRTAVYMCPHTGIYVASSLLGREVAMQRG